MNKKWFILISCLVLVCLFSGLVINQETDDEVAEPEKLDDLGKNLAINLLLEPDEDKEGITIVTATKFFSVGLAGEEKKGHFELHFEGEIDLKDNGQILLTYQLGINGEEKSEGEFAFKLESSVLLKENEPVIISKFKDKAFKLKVSTLK